MESPDNAADVTGDQPVIQLVVSIVLQINFACQQNSVPVIREIESANTPIGLHDQMSAGHARSQGLVLVTNNLREFNRVPGLRIEDWASG